MIGPDGLIYPGTCQSKPRTSKSRPTDTALRLNVSKVAEWSASFMETGQGPEGQTGKINISDQEFQAQVGAIILARRDMGTSYHLSVVLDDAAQGITHVVRGQDLFEATKIHVLLQHLLGVPTPIYHHHSLIRDDAGKRLAKRDDARALSKYRAEGCTPADIRAMVGL